MNPATRYAQPKASAAFLQWYHGEQQKGLVDFKVFCGNLAQSTTEDFFAGVNGLLNAEEVPNACVL